MSVFTNEVNATVVNFPATQPVSGTVAVSNFPVTQPVSGTVTANAGTGNFTVVQPTGTNLHVVVDSGSITTTTGAGSTATITQVSVTNASSIVLLAANASRKRAVIFIPTVGTKLYIGFSATTNITTTFTYIFSANNTTLEVTNYTGVISAIAVGATDLVNVTEIV